MTSVPCPTGSLAEEPLVSVIVRSLGRPTLNEALDSIARQTYPNVEIIVVDAAGHGFPSMATSLGPRTMRVASTGAPLRRSAAANLGLDATRGAYLIFLDDDDLFDPGHVASLVETLRASPNHVAAYAGVRIEDRAGRTLGVYDQDFAAARFMTGNFIPIHAILFRREVLARGCRFDEEFDSYEDWDFWMQLARLSDFVRRPGVSAVYRAHLGESGMAANEPHLLPLQRQARLTVWRKWWPQWSVEDFDRAVADMQARADRADAQRADLAHERDALASALQDARRHMVDLQTQVEDLQAGVDVRDREIEALHTAARERDEHIAAQQARIDDMLRSTSWRVTAPLRAVGHRLRGLRQRAAVLHAALPRQDRGLLALAWKVASVLSREGPKGLRLRLRATELLHANLAPRALRARRSVGSAPQLPTLESIDLDRFEIFFIDVFDTALLRLLRRPADLFDYVAWRNGDAGFRQRRVLGETRARQQHATRRDVTLAQIYNNLPDCSADTEIDAELRLCVPNPPLRAFHDRLLAAGKKVYFVSDMYLDKPTVARLLEHNGYAGYTDLYVSSDDDLIKGDGSRFEALKRELPGCEQRAIHIGDHPLSDYERPRAHGFAAHRLLPAELDFAHDPFIDTKLEALDAADSLGLSFMLGSLRYWKAGFDAPPPYWRQFGFLYGGALVAAFCGFVRDQVRGRGLSSSRVFFLARDGDIMSRVSRVLFDDIEPVYLLASRRCMSLPSMRTLAEPDDADALRLFTTPLGVSGPHDVIERFGYSDLHGLEADLRALPADTARWTDADVRRSLLRHRDALLAKAAAEREVLLEYLDAMRFFEQPDIAIADVGWGGSIQNALHKLLVLGGRDDARLHGFYLGVNAGALHRTAKTGYLFDGDQSGFVDYLNLIELLTASPLDGVVRIARTDSGYAAVPARATDHERRRQTTAAQIQQGILDFAAIALERCDGDLRFMRTEDFRLLFGTLQNYPSQDDVRELGALRHAMTLGNHFDQQVLKGR